MGGVIWLGIFARMHREYAGTPGWQITFDKDAPADLRFAVLALTVGIAYVGLRMVARARRVRRTR